MEVGATAAGIYEWLLGGRELPSAADGVAARWVVARAPEAVFAADQNRRFVRRVGRELARRGVRQFIDLGAGYPTHGPLHEAVAEITPDFRVVYVDADARVAAQGRELVRRDGVVFVTQDLRRPWEVIEDPEVGDCIDLTEPVAVLFAAVLHFVPGRVAYDIVGMWRDHLVAGSYLVISHAVAGEHPDTAEEAASVWDRSTSSMTLRSPSEVERLFTGCEMLDPGLVTTTEWGTIDPAPVDQAVILAGVGRVPEP